MSQKGATMFTQEADAFLLDNWERLTSRQLAEKISELYGIHPKTQTVTDRLNAMGVHRGRCYRPEGYEEPRTLPVGSERIDKNRIVMVKTEMPNKWKPKAQVVAGYDTRTSQAIFLDGNSLNVTKENILVVSKRVHARLAKNGWLNSGGEVIRTGATWSELLYAIRDNAERNEQP